MKTSYMKVMLCAFSLLSCAFYVAAPTQAQKLKQSNGQASLITVNQKNPTAIQVVKKMFAAFNKRDANALAALYADRLFADSPDYPQPLRTRAEVKAHYEEMFRQSPNIRDEVKSIVAAGNKVFVEFVSLGTIENPAKEMPLDVKGKRFELKIASILEIRNGRIVRDVTYYDQLAVLKQLGLMPE